MTSYWEAPEHREAIELSNKGHNALTAALARGDLPPAKTLKCSKCGSNATGYHHHLGYEQEHWLDVIPLCDRCHGLEHRKQISKCKGKTMLGLKCNRAALKGLEYCYRHIENK